MDEPLRAAPRQDAADEPEDDEAPQAEEVECRVARVDATLHGERLDKALVAIAGEFSRNHLQSLIAGGHVRVDAVLRRTASRRVAAGQRIEVELIPTAESRAFRPQPLPLAIVHEDDELLVVDKPAGLVVHPAAGHWSGTLLNALLAHHAAAATLPRAGIVHRLDKDTSGLMVVGKTLPAVTALARAIAAREVRREYLALVHGRVDEPQFTVDAPIGRDPRSRVRMAVLGGGKPARTDVWTLATTDVCSALRCRLHSGRTHQIRVHLAASGHPLVGDALYGGAALFGLERQALHAVRLCLTHPSTGLPLDFVAAPPPDFAAAWRRVHTGAW